MFVELEDELEGLLHVSELADHKVENPKDVVKVADEIEVKILRVDVEDRKIGLSLKRAQWAAEEEAAEAAGESPVKRRGGLEGEGGLLGDMASNIIQTVRQQDAPGSERPRRGANKEIDQKAADQIAMDALKDDQDKKKE